MRAFFSRNRVLNPTGRYDFLAIERSIVCQNKALYRPADFS